MTEPEVARTQPRAAPNPLFLRDEELTRGIELLDGAYRALLAEPGRILAAHGLGRHHQWLLYFIGRHPGTTMVDLLGLMRLTKQNLSRLLAELETKGLIDRQANPRDRRQKLLELTVMGRDLNHDLNDRLQRLLARAYRAAGAEAVDGHHKVLLGLVAAGAPPTEASGD